MSYPVLVADYGMNVYYGGLYDLRARLLALKGIGYDGLERVPAPTAEALLDGAAAFRELSMCYATLEGPTPELAATWAAALGCTYIWAAASAHDHAPFCRQVNEQAAAVARRGITVAVHNHMGAAVESHDDTVRYLEACPSAGLILDTAHLAAVGGDPVEIVRRFGERIVHVHLKDWLAEREAEAWYQRGRFCELGAGNIGLDNAAVIAALRDVGYAGALSIEQDVHLRDPLEDLAVSRRYLADCGV
jgi:sugar phosphate isomerase/epimerase